MHSNTSVRPPVLSRTALAALPSLLACMALAGCGSSDGPGTESAPAALGTALADEPTDEASASGSSDAPGPEPRAVEPDTTIQFTNNLNSLVVTDDAVWVGTAEGIIRVDPETNQPIRQIDVPNLAGYFALAFGSAWVTDYDASIVRRVDPRTGKVRAEIPTGANPESLGYTDDAVWVANHRDGTVTRVDPSTTGCSPPSPLGEPG